MISENHEVNLLKMIETEITNQSDTLLKFMNNTSKTFDVLYNKILKLETRIHQLEQDNNDETI